MDFYMCVMQRKKFLDKIFHFFIEDFSNKINKVYLRNKPAVSSNFNLKYCA